MQAIARIPHVGLSPEPAIAQPTITSTAEIIKLPYMGPSPLDDTVGRPYPTEEIRLKAYVQKENGSDAQICEDLEDPELLLIKKVDRLARMIGCSVHEAERILFDRL